MPQVITDNLDLWTSALLTKSTAGRGSNGKLEAYGIKKLRELILELAVRGQLVAQDPNDEPASELLKRIQAQKAELIASGKIKKDKPLPPIADEEKPFDLPSGWAYSNLGDVVEIVRGITFPGNEKSKIPAKGRVACLRTSNVQDQIEWDDILYIREEFVSREDQLLKPRDIVMSMANSRELVGKVALVGETINQKTTFGGFLGVLRPYLIDPSFVMSLLRTPHSREMLIDSASQTTNIANVSLAKLRPFFFAIPPLAEQHRIVAKVDELMALCDQLEQQQTHSLEAHQTLVETLLGTLTRVASQQELTEAWTRIANHFGILFTTDDSIDQLKQTILQLAVMGKLVPQDPNEEPASVLLETVAKAKGKLVEEEVIRKQDPLPDIEDAETPFTLPAGWSFVRLGNLSKLITKGSSPKWQGVSYTDNPDDVLFVTSENVGSYVLLLDNKKYVEKKFNEVEPRSILEKGDFLMNIVGASIGRTAIYDIDVIANINQAVCLIRVFAELLDCKYLLHFFNSAICVSYMFDKQVDNARANLSMGNIARFVMPLPPLAEQHRIVAKVDKLMALCDALKTRLADAQTIQIHLADAIVEQAVA